MRYFWLSLGLFSLSMGMIGVVVPLLPTTPFILLAAYCFARSSKRLHDWLLNHRHFGPLIENWREHRAIRRSAKVVSTVSIVAIVAISMLFGVKTWILVTQLVVLSGVLVIIWTRPEGKRPTPDQIV